MRFKNNQFKSENGKQAQEQLVEGLQKRKSDLLDRISSELRLNRRKYC